MSALEESWTCRLGEGKALQLGPRSAQTLLLLLILFGAGCAGFGAKKETRLTILHINDLYEVSPGPGGMGGLARLKTAVDGIRKEDPQALLVVSGDILSPSRYSSVTKGAHMVAALNFLGADLATFGNHDFDFGPETLKSMMSESRFKWVVSNVLEDGAQYPGSVYTFIKNVKGINVGFFGLLDPQAMEAVNVPKNIDVMDYVDAATRAINVLVREKADVIVALTHMDEASDLRLASKVPSIHLILGGHDHKVVNRRAGGPLLMKSGYNAKLLGMAAIRAGGEKPVEVEGTHMEISSAIPQDKTMLALLQNYKQELETSLGQIIGETAVELDGGMEANRVRETNMGDFIADTMRENMGADAAIINGGAIRPDRIYKPGSLTKGDIRAILSFGNILCKTRIDGARLRLALERSLELHGKGGFLQIAGMSITADLSLPAGSRLLKALINGQPLADDGVYTLALNDYLLGGGDGYKMLTEGEAMVAPLYGDALTDVLERRIQLIGMISTEVDGRISIIGAR